MVAWYGLMREGDLGLRILVEDNRNPRKKVTAISSSSL
ncbi:predicted protein [Sclerotinia sclerotiorum 1980 UF-70]|uniref:Uncharacterized protein n=1 Tax=Sclerotinia sclerotiorum (strain ATCC 18683 / 1980 / Ss-1) TaxID=665079 RepID=A7EHS1_SCLS1|nr:predicted protein [Sclerotinia sclerotiorum 1980 UF-70]EDO02387.1 predicted protein [Sclerotinia sclerotiorum 1980 UF-70]